MGPEELSYVCNPKLQSVLQHFVLPSLPASVLSNLRATCTLLRTLIDEDSPSIWARASSGIGCHQQGWSGHCQNVANAGYDWHGELVLHLLYPCLLGGFVKSA